MPESKQDVNSRQSESTDVALSLPSSEQQAKRRSASYPAYTLLQAEELAKVIFELGARNCDQDKVAQRANYSVGSGAFRSLRASANQFGLIQLGRNEYISVSDDWVKVFHSEDPQLFKAARKKAMLQPRLYKQLIEIYTGRHLPNLDKLTRELYLNQKYGILRDAAGTAARIFLESASYAGLLNEKGYLVDPDQDEQLMSGEDLQNEEDGATGGEKEQKTKQAQQELTRESSYRSSLQNNDSAVKSPPDVEGLEKYEITLINRKKAYIYVPVPLPYGEKERLKKYIDLILEEQPTPQLKQHYQTSLEDDIWLSQEPS